MALPEVQRIIYKKNPLEEVICQLRFPPILRIETGVPAEFQDVLSRKEYPLYEPTETLAGVVPADIQKLLGGTLSPKGKEHNFLTEDRKWRITLTKDFIALTALAYERWEYFWGHMQKAVTALEKVYEPAYYSRLGLRYKDVIRKSVLGLPGAKWTDLLKPHIAGELGTELADEIEARSNLMMIELEGGIGRARVQHGLAKKEGESEVAYVIDADFFVEGKTESEYVRERLKHFNIQAARLFRWCITDALHEAMGPQPID